MFMRLPMRPILKVVVPGANSRLWLSSVCFFLLICSEITSAHGVHDREGHRGEHDDDDSEELTVEVDYFNIGSSRYSTGIAEMEASGARIETEREIDRITLSLNYERWQYSWKNSGYLPFMTGSGPGPWTAFNTFQFGIEYEHDIRNRWKILYYAEAESSFEEEMSNANEYEIGVDFIFEQSGKLTYMLNVNWEYLDAEGSELGVDMEIEWNSHVEKGWSVDFEISSEFPESSISYHFSDAISAAIFYTEGGTNTIRLSNKSPVMDMQRGYMEDEYIGIGFRLAFELGDENHLSFSVQQNSEREISFIDSSGSIRRSYRFSNAYEFGLRFTYDF